jgi:hypothetical protein
MRLKGVLSPSLYVLCCLLYLQKGEHYHIDDGQDAINHLSNHTQSLTPPSPLRHPPLTTAERRALPYR